MVLRIVDVARSTWYHSQRKKGGRSPQGDEVRRGRPVPRYTKNLDGTIVMDTTIIKALTNYRKDLNFSNAAGTTNSSTI